MTRISRSLYSEGVAFHHTWLSLKEERQAASTMACVDEICTEVPAMGMVIKDRWYAGGLISNGYGMSLEGAIRTVFQVSKQKLAAFVLTTRGYSTMIGRRGHRAVIFDSHPRNKETGMAVMDGESGAAVLVEFEHPSCLLLYLQILYAAHKLPDELYVMQEVGLHDDHLSALAETPKPSLFSSWFRSRNNNERRRSSAPEITPKVMAAGGGSFTPLGRSASWKELFGIGKSDSASGGLTKESAPNTQLGA